MANPEYRQIFNDITESIKEGTYKDQALDLCRKGLTNEDATELCEAIRVATKENRCYITKLWLAGNQLTTLNVEGLTQLETLHLANNQLTTIENIEKLTQLKMLTLLDNPLTTLTRVKFAQLPSLVSDGPLSGVIKPALAEQAQVNNELNEKVDWTTRKLLSLLAREPDAIKSIRSKLQSELQSKLKIEGVLLRPEDSVYIIKEASIQAAERIAEQRKNYNECVQNDSFLFLLPEVMEEKIIPYAVLYSQIERDEHERYKYIGSIKP